MRRYAVINQKGGVGKTTTTANLAAYLAACGNRVLLIDLDPQAHLSLHFDVTLAEADPSIYDVLTSSVPLLDVAIDVRDGIKLIPADIDLAGAETELVSVTGREVILREALEAVDDQFDVMLVDCPPSLGVLTINALVAATDVLIPLQTQFFALQGLSKLLTNTVMLVRRRINPALRVTGIILCMHESATRLANEIVEDLTSFLQSAKGTDVPWADTTVYKTFIRRNVRLAEACSFGQSIFDYAPRSNGALDYASLAREAFPDLCPAEEIDTAATNDASIEPAEEALDDPTHEVSCVPVTDAAACEAVARLADDAPAPEAVAKVTDGVPAHEPVAVEPFSDDVDMHAPPAATDPVDRGHADAGVVIDGSVMSRAAVVDVGKPVPEPLPESVAPTVDVGPTDVTPDQERAADDGVSSTVPAADAVPATTPA